MSTLKIGGYSEGHLLKQAQKIVTLKSNTTSIFDSDAEARIPKFDPVELSIGKVLGRGGFCKVSEVVKVTLKDGNESLDQEGSAGGHGGGNNHDERHLANVVQDRDFMQAHYLRKGKDYRYAIKKLKEEATTDVQTFINGIVDLAIEARFLSVIRHPNIIKMRAISSGTPFSREYFVVLDRLYDILSRTLVSWKKKRPTGMKKLFDGGGRKTASFWVERITVAHDLASALKYLHSLGIVYRDLKPDNIGFDVRGDVKIFDFGLSRQIPAQKSADGLYQMTGDTGSPRYMAPEVALNQSYNQTVDTYSFGILLWQICELSTPFEGFTMKMFDSKVVRGGGRPKCNPAWPPRIFNLMNKCWHTNIHQRPTMEQVVETLREDLSEHSDIVSQDTLDASNKSLHSMHNLARAKENAKK